MTNQKKTQGHRKRKRKLRSEAVVVLTLGGLLLFLMTSMALSLMFTGELPQIPGINITEPVASKHKTIMIDPGHGGYDIGADYASYNEKTITLQIGLLLGENLKQLGYDVVYTRDHDEALGEYELEDLNLRVAASEQANVDAFISLHLNTAEEDITERCYGFEVYHNEQVTLSTTLAQHVHDALNGLNYTMSRGVRDGDHLQVVSYNTKPAILIEMGFLDDDYDRAYLVSSDGQKKIASALANAIDKTFSNE